MSKEIQAGTNIIDAFRQEQIQLKQIQELLTQLAEQLGPFTHGYQVDLLEGIKKDAEQRAMVLAQFERKRAELVEQGLLTSNFELNTTMPGYETLMQYMQAAKQAEPQKIVTTLNQLIVAAGPTLEERLKQADAAKLAEEEKKVAESPLQLEKSVSPRAVDVATQKKTLLDLQRDLRDYGYLGEAPLPTTGKTDAQIAALMQGAAGDKQRFDALMSDFPARDKLLVRLQQVRQQLFDLDILTAAGQENKAKAIHEIAGLERVGSDIRAIIRLNTLIARLQAHQNLHPTPEALKPIAPPPSLVTPSFVSPLPASVASVSLSSSAAAPGSFETRAQDFMTKFVGLERDLASYQTGYRIVQLEALQQRLDQYELDVNRFMNDYHDVTDLSLQQIEQYEQILENETLFDELKPQVQALYQKAQQELTEFNTAFATLDVKTATAPQIDNFTKRYALLKANLTIQDTYQEKYNQATQARPEKRLRSVSAPTPLEMQAFRNAQQKTQAEQAVVELEKALAQAKAEAVIADFVDFGVSSEQKGVEELQQAQKALADAEAALAKARTELADMPTEAQGPITPTTADRTQQLKSLSELGAEQTGASPSKRANVIDVHRRRAASLPPIQSKPEGSVPVGRPRSQSAPQPLQGQLHGQPPRTGFIAELSVNWPRLAGVLESMGRVVGLVPRPAIETRAVTVYPPAPVNPVSEATQDAAIVQQDEKLQLTIQHTCWAIQKLATERQSFITAESHFHHSDATDIGLTIEETLLLLDQFKQDLQQEISDHKTISPALTTKAEQAVAAIGLLVTSNLLASQPEFGKLLEDATKALKPMADVAKIDMTAKPASWKEESAAVTPVMMKRGR